MSETDHAADNVEPEDDPMGALRGLAKSGDQDAVPIVEEYDEHDQYEENGRLDHDGADEPP